MKKHSTQNLKLFAFMLIISITIGNVYSQQVIGTFPNMNGGFESETAGNLSTNSLATGVTSTNWTVSQTASTTYLITNNSSTARTSNKYLTLGNTASASRRWQSPTAPDGNSVSGVQNATAYVIQYYYRTSSATAITNLQTILNLDGGGTSITATNAPLTGTNNNWTKAVVTCTTGTSAVSPRYGVGGFRVSSNLTTINVDVDDYVVYAGTAVDETAPDPATGISFTPASYQIGVSWTAPVSGVDGGGYMVVRHTADPTTAPNVNGIYAVGNTIGSGTVVYIGTGTSFTDVSLSTTTQYFYRVYTVDKAFNYSTALTGSSTTTAAGYATEPTAQVTGLNFSSVTSTGMTINWTPAVSGGGTNHLVVVGTSLSGDPVDGSSYTANTDYTNVGSSAVAGGKVVYNGTGNSVTVSGLTPLTTYYVRVYDFNGSAGTENYYTTSPTSGNQQTLRKEITSAQSGPWATGSTWVGGIAPTSADNVTIANGHVVTFTGISANACYNLTINSGGQLYNITGTPTYTIGYMGVYGTSILVNGTFGDAITEYVTGIQFNQNCTLTGSGTIRINRMRPYTTASNATFTFDTDATLTNSTGVTMMGENTGSNTIGYKINSGRTVTSQGSLTGGSSSSTNASYPVTFTVDGTLDANSAIYLNAASGQSATLTVNGTLNILKLYGSNFTSGGGATPTITVNGSGVINVTGTNALADFSNPTTAANITGTGTFTLASGATLSVGSTDGLNPTTGPIRCTTRNFNTAANYTFTGSSAQVTGSDLPATVNTLTNTNTAGLTLSGNLTATTLTNAATYILNIDANKQLTVSTTLTNNGTINLKSTASGTATLIPPATITGTGTFNVEQYLGTARNWYVSSPVASTASTTTKMSKYFEYITAGNNNDYASQPSGSTLFWMGYTPGATFMTPGKGYIALPSETGATLTFSGALNTGDVNVPISSAGNRFNLIGNPYPCHIAWSQAYTNSKSAQIEPSIYIRTNSGGSNSGGWSYATYNASNGQSVPNHSLLSGGIIPPMQAFWVRAVASAASPLVLNSTDLTRSHQSSNPLKAPALKNTDRQKLRLEVSNGTRTDETLLLFDANAADGYDAFDSPKYMESSSEVQIYTTVDTQKLVMNGMRNLPLDQEIGLGFIPGSATSFSLKANEISNLPSDVKVILKDNVTLAETDLTDGVTAYNFSPATTSGNRFSVIFRTAGVATGIEKTENLNSQVFVNAANQITIIAPEKSNYAIYNTMGQQIAAGITTNRLSLITNHLKGVFVVKVNNQSTKVIIK